MTVTTDRYNGNTVVVDSPMRPRAEALAQSRANARAQQQLDRLALSFVVKRPGRKGGVIFWNVDPSGDYTNDWESGELLGLEALEFMARETETGLSGDLLVRVVLAMPREDDRTGVELGFLRCIGHFAALARQRFGDKHYRDWREQRARFGREQDDKMAAERSERARKAAQARWARRDHERLSAAEE